MRTQQSLRLGVLLLVLSLSIRLSGQQAIFIKQLEEENATLSVGLSDEVEIYGVVSEIKNGLVYFQSEELGEVQFSTKEVNWVENMETKKGKIHPFKNRNINPDNYFLAPTSIPIPAGETHFRTTFFIFNSFDYAIDNSFSLSAGLDFLHFYKYLKDNTISNNYYFSLSYKKQIGKKLYASAGYLQLKILGNRFSLPFAGLTLGNSNSNASLLYAHNLELNLPGSSPTLMIGAQKRVKNNLILAGEIFCVATPGEEGLYNREWIISYGLKQLLKSSSFELSFYNSRSITEIFSFGIPTLSYTKRF